MNTMMKAVCLSAVVLTLQPALAADNCTGYDVLVTQSAETLDLGKGQSLTVMRQHSILTTENAPLHHLMTGECTASILSSPDGKVRASGHCARRDKDGDTDSIEWAQAPGAARSTWVTTGGSGKFAARSGSGWAEEVRADGKVSVVKWGGTCK